MTGTAPEIRVEMLSRPRLLAATRALVGTIAQRMGFNEVSCGQISLAVDEAICNIINHGYERRDDGPIWLSIWSLDGAEPGVKIVLEDRARQVDPETICSRDLEDVRPGGLGVFIIREVMDDAVFEHREGGGMRLTMIKHIHDLEADPAPETGSAATSTSEPAND